MSGICLPIDASAGAPSFPAAQHRVAQALLLAPTSGRPLGARSGVRPGAEPTITATATQWTVTPFVCGVDPGTGLAVGPYLCAFLANETGGVNAADQTYTRIDRLDVQVPDDPPGASPRNAVIVYTAGDPSANPAAKPAPARSTPLATITVPKAGGGAPSVATTWLYLTASGGIIPARGSSEYPSAPYAGQAVYDRAQNAVKVWNGSAWVQQINEATRTRAWHAPDRAGTSDNYSAGVDTQLGGMTITAAPAGTYQVVSRLCLSSGVAGPGFAYINFGSQTQGNIRADVSTARQTITLVFTFVHTGGDVVVTHGHRSTAGTGTVWNGNATALDVYWLGP